MPGGTAGDSKASQPCSVPYAIGVSTTCQRSTVCRSGPKSTQDLAVARAAAIAAGQLIRDRFGRADGIRRSGRHDVKADVDVLAEQIVVDHLRGAFPGDAIVAEESGSHSGDAGGPTGQGVRTWLVDPLDGTVNFASGIPFVSVSLALVVDGRTVVGVVHDPLRDETWEASLGGGARGTTSRGKRLRIRPLAGSDDAVVAIDPGDPDEVSAEELAILEAIRGRVRVARTFGSSALSLAWVGAGRLDGFVRPAGIQPLDVMAGALVASEAGAMVGDPGGAPWPDLAEPGLRIGIVAAHPRVHRLMVAAFRR